MPSAPQAEDEKPLMRHLVQLLIVLAALICAGVLAFAIQWYLFGRSAPGAAAGFSTSTPDEMTFEQKMRLLQSGSGPDAPATGTSATLPSDPGMTAAQENAQAAAHEALLQPDAAQGGSDSSDDASGGLTQEQKMQLLQ